MEELKKETLSQVKKRTTGQSEEPSPPSSEPAENGVESSDTLILNYGRINPQSGEGYLFEKILLCCYQCLNNNNNFLDIQKLCDWFHTHWNITIGFEKASFYTLFPANIHFKPTFNPHIFTASSAFPDSKLPGEMKEFAHEYAEMKNLLGSSPSTLKRACLLLIAILIDRIYSNTKYMDIRERNIILDRVLNFLQMLQRSQGFYFLREGTHFKQYLQPAITTLTDGLDEVKSIINQPKQIPTWLRDYLEHAKNIIDGLPLYTHYMLQGTDIKIASIKYALEEIYKKYISILSGEERTISLTRLKEVKQTVGQASLIIKTNTEKEKVQLAIEDIRKLITDKKISLSQAGFYIDYILNQPQGMSHLEQATQGKITFFLSADQFLRELIYNPGFCQAIFTDVIVKEGLDYYCKLTTNKDMLECSLTLLRQHVLRTDKTIKSAAEDKKQQGNPIQFLELAERALKPQLIDFSFESNAYLTAWAPGVFSVFQKESKKTTVQTASREYFNLLCLLTAVNQELAAYSWFIQTLEKACFSSGSLQVTILHRKFLINLSQRTLDPLQMVKKALFEFRNPRRESAKEILVAEATRINKPLSNKWASIGLEVAKKEFFIKMISSISELDYVCRSLDDYVNDTVIQRHIKQTAEIDRMLEMAASITMPDVEEYMRSARQFSEDARKRLSDFLHPPKLEKSTPLSPSVEPKDAKIPPGVLSKISMFTTPLKLRRSIDNDKKLVHMLADLCFTNKGVLDLTTESPSFRRFFRQSDDLVTDQAKYNCAISLLNATEACISSIQMHELYHLTGAIALIIKLLSPDNIFFLTQANLYESLQDKLKILNATLMLFKEQKPTPEDAKQIADIFQSIGQELSSVYVIEQSILQEANEIINKFCNLYCSRYGLSLPIKNAALSLRNTAAHELDYSQIKKLFAIFEKNKRFICKIIYAHSLTKSLVSNYYLQDERTCLVNYMTNSITDTICDYCLEKDKLATRKKFRPRIKKLFNIFTPDCTQNLVYDKFFTAETCFRLHRSFNLPISFNFDNDAYEYTVDKEKKYSAPKIAPEAVNMLLFMLNALRRIDRNIITRLPKSYNKHEEQQADLYLQFKQEVEHIMNYDITPTDKKQTSTSISKD
ncbi:MAG TPA: hypothetical protein VHE99_12005 [Gammaproteobacteria bacterium]|nr:hypothetical protein [Gammaproteobacteria bacterium]